MSREVTPRSSLETLKREAKRWLKALKANVADARARLERALPNPPAIPTLRDVQHALAREHGLMGWKDLREAVGAKRESETPYEVWVERFLGVACPDHHVRGPTDHLRARSAAMRILERFPQIASHDFYTAIVCGNIEMVRAALARDPGLARRKRAEPSKARSDAGGEGDELRHDFEPKGWEPLPFLCFTRLPLAAPNDNAMEMARLLLDAGADPKAFFMAGSSEYTPLVGVVGEGEEERPPHPHRDELARLLMERGANPYDQQVLYNIHFHRKTLWFLKLMHEFSVKAGRQKDWEDPNWPMLDMGGYGSGAYFQLLLAVRENDLELARWILDHGASPNAPGPKSKSMVPGMDLMSAALRLGHFEVGGLLMQHGAPPIDMPQSGVEALTSLTLSGMKDMAESLVTRKPSLLESPEPMFAAIRAHNADAVRFLLKLGVSADAEDSQRQRPLHIAAYGNEVEIIRLLIDAGAEIDPRESNWSNTPLGAATWSQARESIDLLAPLSRDVWELTMNGKIDRLRELFAETPELGKTRWKDETPLMWLPDDDQAVMDIVQLFLDHGADPTVRNEDGMTAGDKAERRGMFDIATLLREAEQSPQ